MKVEIYSDVACPWCYIGERRFSRALAAFPQADRVEVVFRPYQLDPGAPEPAVPLPAYLEKRYGPRATEMLARVSETAAAEGITLDWDRALAGNTRSAHRLMRLAEREYGSAMQHAVAERLFALYFTHGGDVTEMEALVGAAEAAGMDPERTRAYLASDEGKQELEAEFSEARALGVRAVPTFVFDGRRAVSGAQPTSVFLEALEETARVAVPAEGDGEGCADGICAV